MGVSHMPPVHEHAHADFVSPSAGADAESCKATAY